MGNNITSSKPVVSIVSSAIRPDNWLEIYNSVDEDENFFEFFFVGPNQPNYKLPKNFFFTKSFVKPAQCWQYAYENCNGEFVINLADDLNFKTQKPLTRLYEEWLKKNDERKIIACEYSIDDKKISHDDQKILPGYQSQYVPACMMLEKKAFQLIGGIDTRFIAVYWNHDLCLRLHKEGYNTYFADVVVNESKKVMTKNTTLFYDYTAIDGKLFDNIWMKKNASIKPWGYAVLNERRLELNSYHNIDLIRINQGEAGRWKNTNTFYGKMIASKYFFLIRKYLRIIHKVTTSFSSLKYYYKKFIYKVLH